MLVHESQIEDVFVNSPDIVRSVLNIDDEPRLLVRQMQVPSGRLDLLYSYKSSLLLVELKVVGYKDEYISQVTGYRNDLLELQSENRLLKADVIPYLLCTRATQTQIRKSIACGVQCLPYSPEYVLQHYYLTSKPIAALAEIKPIDIGIWNIHLINKFIYHVDLNNTIDQLHSIVGGSRKTLYNKIKFASELRLVNWAPNSHKVYLSELGHKYVQLKNHILPTTLSAEQIELLNKHIAQNPYESSVILGIASIVESVYYLAKNSYPVKMSDLFTFFAFHSGKSLEWKTDKAKYNATRMYSNYAVDLGLLAKTKNDLFITPQGFRFVGTMQLHKSLRVIESLR